MTSLEHHQVAYAQAVTSKRRRTWLGLLALTVCILISGLQSRENSFHKPPADLYDRQRESTGFKRGDITLKKKHEEITWYSGSFHSELEFASIICWMDEQRRMFMTRYRVCGGR